MTKNNFEKGIVLISLAFFALFLITNASAKLAFDNDCPVSLANNVNFSNGTAVFLLFNYTETSTINSNLTVFLGTNTDYFCSAIDDDLATFAASRKVIFTPEFLNALKTSSCSATFEDYMENYRKSGNILNSSGTVFCGIKNLTFDATTNPSGITFDYPYNGRVNIDSNHYNGTHLKKYMLAYLMNHPDAELSGIISTFADAINVNLTATCSDAPTIAGFFNQGKNNYTKKFKPSLLGINWTSGEELEPSGGVSGVFGWLLNYALGNQILPVITAANLSTNKIYVCGTVALNEYYSNSTVTTSNNQTTVNSTETNVLLEIKTNSPVTNANIEIAEYPENPQTVGVVSMTALNKYIGIKISSSLENALSSVIIEIYYTDAEVSAAGLQESTLRLYYYNETSSLWQAYDSPNGGVNATENYVWANTTHFSDWGIFGTAPAGSSHHRGTIMPAMNTTAGCSIQWSCIEWSQCINGIQTRFCNNAGTCNLNPVKETRSCIITPIVPVTIPTSTPARTESAAAVPTAGPTITRNAISKLLDVPLRTGLFSLIAALVIIGIISWTILMKRNQKIEEAVYRFRRNKRKTRKRARKQKKKAGKRKRRK